MILMRFFASRRKSDRLTYIPKFIAEWSDPYGIWVMEPRFRDDPREPDPDPVRRKFSSDDPIVVEFVAPSEHSHLLAGPRSRALSSLREPSMYFRTSA
jgi:hypothetical protein